MIKKVLVVLLVLAIVIVSYFVAWPVPIDPRAGRGPPPPPPTGGGAPPPPNPRITRGAPPPRPAQGHRAA
jgi:hypothetical protein